MSATLPSDIAQLVDQLRVRFGGRVEADIACEEIPDFLKAGWRRKTLLGTDRETWSLPIQEAAVDLATDESCAPRPPRSCSATIRVWRWAARPRCGCSTSTGRRPGSS